MTVGKHSKASMIRDQQPCSLSIPSGRAFPFGRALRIKWKNRNLRFRGKQNFLAILRKEFKNVARDGPDFNSAQSIWVHLLRICVFGILGMTHFRTKRIILVR